MQKVRNDIYETSYRKYRIIREILVYIKDDSIN